MIERGSADGTGGLAFAHRWCARGRAALSDRRVFAALLLTAGAVELALIVMPDTMGDLLEYRRWTRVLATRGLRDAYWPPGSGTVGASDPANWAVDYPPVFPYLLWLVGRCLAWLAPGALANDGALDAIVRAPLLLAHWLCGAAIAVFIRRRYGVLAGRLALAVHVLNPALVFDTCYWGQADALVGLGLVASVAAVCDGRSRLGWMALSFTVLVKPIAVPFFALLALVELRDRGVQRTLPCVLVALATALAVLGPFACIGRLSQIARTVLLQIDAMPYASVNAHNLWWLVTGGLPWTPADAPFLFGLTYRVAGYWLFGAFLAATLAWLWRAQEPLALPMAAAGTALAAFVLSTHMHENHLYYFLPLLLLASPAGPGLRRIYWVATVALLANMALHDPYLRHLLGPRVPGPRLLLPPAAPLGRDLTDYLLRNGYSYVVEQYVGVTTLWRIILCNVASVLNLGLLASWMAVMVAHRGSLAKGRP